MRLRFHQPNSSI
jgi:hypothetical protein